MEILRYLNENKKIIFNKTYMIMTTCGCRSCCCNSQMIYNEENSLVCSACGRYGVYM